MSAPETAAEVARLLADAMERHHLPYALGGAIALGFYAAAVLATQASNEGQFRGRVGPCRVDVFVPAIAYYAELETRCRHLVLLERPVWVVGPEDLAVLKLMFFRRKDLADVEALLREQGPALDRGYIRGKLTQLVGETDPRVSELAAIERDVDH